MGKWNNWTPSSVTEEAKKYSTRTEFKSENHSAYNYARQHGLLETFDWMKSTRGRKPYNSYWNYDTCYKEAQKYSCAKEFKKGSNSACTIAYKNGWINDYTWFVRPRKYTKESCAEIAKKYKSRTDFNRGCSSAYEVARTNGWLDEYTWLSVVRPNEKWSREACYEEAMKYKTKSEFVKCNQHVYQKARKNGWLSDYTWFVDGRTKD